MPKSPRERAAAYRARKRERGEKPRSGKSGVSKQFSFWSKGDFVAIDGEGKSIGEAQIFKVGKDGKTYHAKEHIYNLLSASSGQSLYNRDNRLDSQEAIDYLLDLSVAIPRGIFVIFAGGYDINHILMFGFKRDFLLRVSRGETMQWESKGITYNIEYRARKSLTLRRGLEFKVDKKNKFKPVWKDRIIIWDVFGFFQESFIGVTKKWLGESWQHYDLIKKMKALRGEFETVDQVTITRYNTAELETLVAIMNKVRAAIDGLDLICNRWDGAGAVAGAIMRKHDIKDFKKETPVRVIDAVRCAYAGGRIEICKIGYHQGEVYDYDINSAYPDVMRKVPCMKCGLWYRYGKGNDWPGKESFALFHVKWNFPAGERFYPLFYRTEKMQISFPSQGEGWYWTPEFYAAYEKYGEYIEILECWLYTTPCNHKPFHWIEDYYVTRQRWLKNPTEEWQRGGEKIIKLGLNSLYGKTAQQLGGRNGKPPAYHQLEWAGYITAATRARLFCAAREAPDTIIGFATDGIFTTRPLGLACSTTKEIGAWELKEPKPHGMTIAMAGVYWWHYQENEYGHFSRGFDKDSMKTPDKILQAWKEGYSEIDIPMHRLIGMGSACASDTLWEMRGRFTEGFRSLRLDGKSHKRQPCNVLAAKPHKKLVDLEPALNIEYAYDMQGCSFPYPIQWLTNIDEEYQNDLELQREMSDTENI